MFELILNKTNKIRTPAGLDNNERNTPLHLAVASNKGKLEMPRIEELLIQNIKDITFFKNNKGQFPIMTALIYGSKNNQDPVNVVKALINDGRTLIQSDKNYNTPLHIAATCKNSQISLSLIFKHSPKNIT